MVFFTTSQLNYTEITQVIGYAQHFSFNSCWVFGLTEDNRYVASNYYEPDTKYHNEKHAMNKHDLNSLIRWFQDKGWDYAPLSDVQSDYWMPIKGRSYVNPIDPQNPITIIKGFARNLQSEWEKLLHLLPTNLIPLKPKHAIFPEVPPTWNGKNHPPVQQPALPPHWKGANHAPQQGCQEPIVFKASLCSDWHRHPTRKGCTYREQLELSVGYDNQYYARFRDVDANWVNWPVPRFVYTSVQEVINILHAELWNIQGLRCQTKYTRKSVHQQGHRI